jgi:hypothetical protein
MGTKRKARKPATPSVNRTALETAEVVAVLRQLREKMGVVEELEPDNWMLRDYQHMRGWAIIELRRIRAGVELELCRQGASRRERKIAAEHLQLIALVESESLRRAGTWRTSAPAASRPGHPVAVMCKYGYSNTPTSSAYACPNA